jgi:hypothetical protein
MEQVRWDTIHEWNGGSQYVENETSDENGAYFCLLSTVQQYFVNRRLFLPLLYRATVFWSNDANLTLITDKGRAHLLRC